MVDVRSWKSTLLAAGLLQAGLANASDRIELDITTIKGNRELPRIIYVVPWKEIEHSQTSDYKLVLHSLYGDLFDPVLPKHMRTGLH
ncbi:MAG: hypothetical protein WDA11_13865 [Thiohalomonadaceae bacterium]